MLNKISKINLGIILGLIICLNPICSYAHGLEATFLYFLYLFFLIVIGGGIAGLLLADTYKLQREGICDTERGVTEKRSWFKNLRIPSIVGLISVIFGTLISTPIILNLQKSFHYYNSIAEMIIIYFIPIIPFIIGLIISDFLSRKLLIGRHPIILYLAIPLITIFSIMFCLLIVIAIYWFGINYFCTRTSLCR
jgi:hypothetical protein